jgi:hypothetical protein
MNQDERMQTTNLRPDTEEAAETIDAALFTGDEFLDGTARGKLREYLERWTRALNELDASDEGETPVELKPVREALEMLKVEAPAKLLALRLAAALQDTVSPTHANLCLASFCDDMGYLEADELSPLFRELMKFHPYPARDGVAMQAGIISEYVLEEDLSCEFQFSRNFVSLVKTLS